MFNNHALTNGLLQFAKKPAPGNELFNFILELIQAIGISREKILKNISAIDQVTIKTIIANVAKSKKLTKEEKNHLTTLKTKLETSPNISLYDSLLELSSILAKSHKISQSLKDKAQEHQENNNRYKKFIEFIENLHRIPKLHTEAQQSSITHKTVSLQTLADTLTAFLSTPEDDLTDLYVTWLSAANAPTAVIRHQDEACVIRVVLLSKTAVEALQSLIEFQNQNPMINPIVPIAHFVMVEIPRNLPLDIAANSYNLVNNNPNNAFYFSVLEYLANIKRHEELIAGDLSEIFTKKRDKQSQDNFFKYDVINITKLIAQQFLQMWNISDDPNKKILYIDPKLGNIRLNRNSIPLLPDPKGFLTGATVKIHLHNDEWCFNAGNEVLTNTTPTYLPNYLLCDDPNYRDHCPIFKFYSTAICKILFELITGINDRKIAEVITNWNTYKTDYPLLQTKLGGLILKGLNNEIDDLEKLISLLNDPENLLKIGELTNDELPPPRNPIVINLNTSFSPTRPLLARTNSDDKLQQSTPQKERAEAKFNKEDDKKPGRFQRLFSPQKGKETKSDTKTTPPSSPQITRVENPVFRSTTPQRNRALTGGKPGATISKAGIRTSDLEFPSETISGDTQPSSHTKISAALADTPPVQTPSERILITELNLGSLHQIERTEIQAIRGRERGTYQKELQEILAKRKAQAEITKTEDLAASSRNSDLSSSASTESSSDPREQTSTSSENGGTPPKKHSMGN